MVRLNYNGPEATSVNTISLWSDNKVTEDVFIFKYIPDFYDVQLEFTGSVVSNKTSRLGGWLLVEIPNDQVNITTGYGNASIYESVDIIPTWLTATEIWTQISDTWENYIIENQTGSLFGTERVFIENVLDSRPTASIPTSSWTEYSYPTSSVETYSVEKSTIYH